ncbi:MAG: type II secretion system protein GspJ [Gammaproteobacteria bacterium]
MIGPRAQSGLTLVEMVVAIGLLALIMLLLYQGTYTLSRTSNAVESNVERLEGLIATHRVLRRELAQMQPAALRDARNAPIPAFTGHRAGMRWLAPLPVHRGAFGLHWLALAVEGEGSARTLILTYSPMTRDEPTATPSPAQPDGRVVLLEQVAEVDFQFLVKDELGRQTRWQTDWNETAQLPAAVRIVVKRSDGSAPVDWLFPVRAIQDAGSAGTEGLFEGA